jgi:hypothetical protein
MVWWIVLVVVNLGMIAAAVVLRRGADARKRLLRLALVLGALMLLSVLAGAGCGVLRASGAVGAPVDPSQKARLLAEGISEAMNCTAFGVIGFFVPLVAALALGLTAPRSAAPPR